MLNGVKCKCKTHLTKEHSYTDVEEVRWGFSQFFTYIEQKQNKIRYNVGGLIPRLTVKCRQVLRIFIWKKKTLIHSKWKTVVYGVWLEFNLGVIEWRREFAVVGHTHIYIHKIFTKWHVILSNTNTRATLYFDYPSFSCLVWIAQFSFRVYGVYEVARLFTLRVFKVIAQLKHILPTLYKCFCFKQSQFYF